MIENIEILVLQILGQDLIDVCFEDFALTFRIELCFGSFVKKLLL